MSRFPYYRQLGSQDCGPTCLKMIAKYYGKTFSLDHLRNITYNSKRGSTFQGLSDAANNLGFRTIAVKISLQELLEKAPLPCILHWKANHFVILIPQKFKKNKSIRIADPARGIVSVNQDEFVECWLSNEEKGVALFLQPTPDFFKYVDLPEKNSGFYFLLSYIKPHTNSIVQILLSLIAGSLVSLILPFLMQILVDKGINYKDTKLVNLILLAQIALFLGITAMEMIRGWIFLHMNSRINVAIISDFLYKLMKLPMAFFDLTNIGDIKQRITDNQRIQNFLTGSTLNTLFGAFSFLIFSIVLANYSLNILIVFIVLSILSVLWIIFFLKRRKKLDQQRFKVYGENESLVFELVSGMQEIKLNNAELGKRHRWENLQIELYYLNIASLRLNQFQQIGATFITQVKNIIITYIAANEVINGHITLGMMMSISYIIGQLNAPIEQTLDFIQDGQDAKLSFDRIAEIHNKDIEDIALAKGIDTVPKSYDSIHFDSNKSIDIVNLSFQYEGPSSPYALKDITFSIPEGKITAIVGTSGSGKTTLLKLLMQYYKPTSGTIHLGMTSINSISPASWRRVCGVVMQDGYIFSESIIDNITLGYDEIDMERIYDATKKANIFDFIQTLPLNFYTVIGGGGQGISNGQRQRILLARAIYKNPEFLFLDEATSSLDANNEAQIIQNLNNFYVNRTVVLIAHRLSTVKNADQIIVLEKGEIVEKGSHIELIAKQGFYFQLVKNQLELGA